MLDKGLVPINRHLVDKLGVGIVQEPVLERFATFLLALVNTVVAVLGHDHCEVADSLEVASTDIEVALGLGPASHELDDVVLQISL